MPIFYISKNSYKNVFLFLWLCSKELTVTLKCSYEKKQPIRNHIEIMFAFEIFHEED